MNRRKGLAAAVLSLSLMLSGCGLQLDVEFRPGREALLEIEGDTLEMAEGKLVLMEAQYRMEEEYSGTGGEEFWSQTAGDGRTFEEYLKEETVLNELLYLEILNAAAEERGVSLSAAEVADAQKAGQEYFAQMTEAEKKMPGASEEDVCSLIRSYRNAENMIGILVSEAGVEVSQEEARVITVSHILLRTEGMDASRKEEARKQAEELWERIQGGEDFDSLASQFNQDGKTRYTISRGETEEAFEEAAFALETGQVSPVTETPEGFEIIKSVSSYEESLPASNRESIRKEREKEVWQKYCSDWLEEKDAAVNQSSWEKADLQTSGDRSEKRLFEIYRTYFQTQE